MVLYINKVQIEFKLISKEEDNIICRIKSISRSLLFKRDFFFLLLGSEHLQTILSVADDL